MGKNVCYIILQIVFVFTVEMTTKRVSFVEGNICKLISHKDNAFYALFISSGKRAKSQATACYRLMHKNV